MGFWVSKEQRSGWSLRARSCEDPYSTQPIPARIAPTFLYRDWTASVGRTLPSHVPPPFALLHVTCLDPLWEAHHAAGLGRLQLKERPFTILSSSCIDGEPSCHHILSKRATPWQQHKIQAPKYQRQGVKKLLDQKPSTSLRMFSHCPSSKVLDGTSHM